MIIFKSWFINVLLGLDQLGNAFLCGNPDETISSRLGRYKQACGGVIPWSSPVARVVQESLDFIDPGHCEDAIEPWTKGGEE